MTQEAILYIEDNYHNRRIVRKILQALGYVLYEAEDGLSGLQMARDIQPSLILLDMGLPRMDGLEVLAEIRRDLNLRHATVMALTAFVMRGDRERFLEAGCDDYLAKPIQARQLINKVQSHFRQQRGVQTSERTSQIAH
jgi:CheY-like chemotaxis protein